VGYYWLHSDCGCQSFGDDPAYMGGKSPLLCHHQSWDTPKRGLNYDGNEYSHNGNVVVGDANIDTTAGKGFGTTTSPAHAPAMNDSAHGGDKASTALKMAA